MKTSCFRTALMCLFLLLAAFCSQLTAQSLDEIIEARPDVAGPVTEPAVEPQTPVQEAPAAEPASDLEAMRRRIVELAGSMVGTVVDKKGDDGYKIGWQNLKKFYEVAYKINDLEKDRSWWMADIKGVGKKVNDWCGIFCVWAWRSAGLPVHWNTRVVGCKYRGQTNLLAAGDIVIIKDKDPEKPLNHHCIVKSVSGNTVETIDGNQGVESIKFRTRKISDISILYSVAEAMGSTPQPQTGNTQVQIPSTQKPSTTGSATTKPQTSNNSGSAKPPATTGGTGTAPADNGQSGQLSQKEIDDIISQVMMLIKITLGSFF